MGRPEILKWYFRGNSCWTYTGIPSLILPDTFDGEYIDSQTCKFACNKRFMAVTALFPLFACGSTFIHTQRLHETHWSGATLPPDISSDPPFAGWAHNFYDRPADPLTLLQNPHCKVDLATSWPSGCFSLLLYLERASKHAQFGLQIDSRTSARNFKNFASTNLHEEHEKIHPPRKC